jgi:peptidoglycan/LPS O-acetylase OafA/YrhL
MSIEKGASGSFISRLESLRGIAALWVAVCHSMFWLSIGAEKSLWSKTLVNVQGVQATVARIVISFFNGAAAVDVFFVLSGFVLARSLSNTEIGAASYMRFSVKRLFRIIPAYWFSLAVVLVYLGVVYPGYENFPVASAWFGWWYTDPVTLRTVLDNAVFSDSLLNPISWTLRIEVLASLLIPVIVWLMGPRGAVRSIIVVLVTFLIAWFDRGDAAGVARFLYAFALGSVIAKHSSSGAAPTFYPTRFWGWTCMGMIMAANIFFPLDHSFVADIMVIAGSGGIVWSLSIDKKSRQFSVLDAGWARFLGKISYSFYLLHFIVLYAIANVLLHAVPANILARVPMLIMGVSCVVSIALTIPLALLSFNFVERPFTAAGRHLSSIGRPSVQA